MFKIPLIKPRVHPDATRNLNAAIAAGNLAGRGPFSDRCEARLVGITGSHRALLTPSGKAALELAAMTVGLESGDEVIMPSFTFPSTASAVALRRAVPVFCDVRPDTLNVDARLIAECLTPRTRAVMVVHYAGNPAEMFAIKALCEQAGLLLIEDAAQALGASLGGIAAGCFGQVGALSFHATKNIGCGEGGAMLVNDPALVDVAEVIQDKGTDRAAFLRKNVGRYTWQALGSSWVVGELTAAFLDAQLNDVEVVAEARRQAWQRYHRLLQDAEARQLLTRPALTQGARHNGHIYQVILPNSDCSQRVCVALGEHGIEANRHYVPLHSSPAGRRLGRILRPLPVTDDLPERLLRLPIWPGISESEQQEVADRLVHSIHANLERPPHM